MRITAQTWTTYPTGLPSRGVALLVRAGIFPANTYAPHLPVTLLLPVDVAHNRLQRLAAASKARYTGRVQAFEADETAGIPVAKRAVTLPQYDQATGILASWRAESIAAAHEHHKLCVGGGAGGIAASVWASINTRDDQPHDWAGEGSAVDGELGERYGLLETRATTGCHRDMRNHVVRPTVGGRALSTEAAAKDCSARAAKQLMADAIQTKRTAGKRRKRRR